MPLQLLFEDGSSEYEFENKEYLINIEKDNVSSVLTSSSSNQPQINANMPKEAKKVVARMGSFQKPRSLHPSSSSNSHPKADETNCHSVISQKPLENNNSSLIQPRCIPQNPLSTPISTLLQLLEPSSQKRSISIPSASSEIPFKVPHSNGLLSKTLSGFQESSSQSVSQRSSSYASSNSSILLSTPSSTLSLQSQSQSQSSSYSSSINYLSCSIELSLPSIHEIRSQNPAFYSSSSSSPTLPSNASLQQYSKWVEDTCVRIIKYTIYTALSQYESSFYHSPIHSFTH